MSEIAHITQLIVLHLQASCQLLSGNDRLVYPQEKQLLHEKQNQNTYYSHVLSKNTVNSILEIIYLQQEQDAQ